MTIGESLIEVQPGEELPIDPSSLMTIAQPVNRSGAVKPLVLDPFNGTPSPNSSRGGSSR